MSICSVCSGNGCVVEQGKPYLREWTCTSCHGSGKSEDGSLCGWCNNGIRSQFMNGDNQSVICNSCGGSGQKDY